MPGHNRVGGTTSAHGKRWFHPFDPRTGQPTADRFPEATAEEITQAIELALDAVPIIASFSSGERARLLRGLAEQLERHSPRLTAQADVETGLGRAHVVAELADCCQRLRHLALLVADGADVGAHIRFTGSECVRTVWRGHGPVVAIGSDASPFVFGVPGSDTATALAAGCPVIAKASCAHPATAESCAAVIDGTLRANGWPAGGHALLHGLRASVTEDMVAAGGIAAVGFTGPRDVGRELFDLANARPDPIPFFATFGSVNPVVVRPGAITRSRDRIAAEISAAVTLAGGQSYVRPGLLVVPAAVNGDWFLDAIASQLRTAGRQPMLTSQIHADFATAVAQRVALPGVTPLVDRVIDASQGYEQEPVMLLVGADDLIASPLLVQECFGPLLIAVRTREDQVLDVLEALPGSLIAAVYADTESDDSHSLDRLLGVLSARSGRVTVNQPPAVPDAERNATQTGPWPAAVASAPLSPGPDAIRRWQRAVTYESVPDAVLPPPLRDANPWNIQRMVDGSPTRRAL